MSSQNGDVPPPGFLEDEDPPNYDIEALIQLNRIEGDLVTLIEQILALDPLNGRMRIELILQRIWAQPPKTVIDRGLH